MGLLDDKSEITEEAIIKVIDPQQIENLIEKRKDQVWFGNMLFTFYYVITLVYLQLNYTYKPFFIVFYWIYVIAIITCLIMHKRKTTKYAIYIFQQLTIFRISFGLLEHDNRKQEFDMFESTIIVLNSVQSMMIISVSMFYIRQNKIASIVGTSINFML